MTAKRLKETGGRRAVWLFLALLAAAAILQALPFLFMLIEGDAGAALYVIHLYAAIPICALVLPFFASVQGVHPLAACFPIGLFLLFSPIYQATGVALLCLALGMIGATGGAEWRRRRHPSKGKKHGK